ncbi:uncharacterized protein [Miscanthus floridulus]|uniref:uncharacterized protein n=1 Tax=Miscanthus floridulus TaxID=154761 RepID=UPI003459D342
MGYLFQTDWEGGYFPLTLHFSEDYPSNPPKCKFPQGWRPAITVMQVFIGIQDLLDQPNPADPAQTDGYHLFIQDPTEYKRRVRLQAKQYPALFLLVRAPPASVAAPPAASVPWPRRPSPAARRRSTQTAMARRGSSQDLRHRTVRPPRVPAPAMAEPPAAHRSSPRFCILYTWVCAW